MCKMPLSNVRVMSKHFKLFHRLNEMDTYRCTFNNTCNQFVSSFSSLSRHFKAHLQVVVAANRNALNDNDNVSIASQSSLACSSTASDFSESLQCCSEISLPSSPNSFPNDATLVENGATLNDSFSASVDENLEIPQNDLPDIGMGGVAFALQLHNNNNFTRKDVDYIQKNVMENVLNPLLATLKKFYGDNFANDLEHRLNFSELIQQLQNPFKNCTNYYQLTKWLLEKDLMCNYELFTINAEIGEKYRRGVLQYEEVETTGVLLPLSFQFRKVFECNDQLLATLKNMERIANHDALSNSHFIQGPLWCEKSRLLVEANKIVIPFFLYIDDSEINNPLGSHCDPISFLYYSFPVIDNCEIFLAAALRGKDYKEYGNEKCLRALIRDITILERDGIEIATSEGVKTVHFMLGLFLGDNLGINTVLGFALSFSANFFCRFCKVIKTTTHTQCVANLKLARTVSNYEADLAANDLARRASKRIRF